MSKVEQAKDILNSIGFPSNLQVNVCIYSLLALSNVTQSDKWKDATNEWIRIHDLMFFIKEEYGVTYAENSRETFRKTAMAD